MKRVLHIVYQMNRGGIETFLMNIYRNIDTENIQFDFIVRKQEMGEYDNEIKQKGGKIYFIPARRNHLKGYMKLWETFYQEHPEYDVIHYHVSSLADITPLIAAKKCNRKTIIIHAHSSSQKLLLNKILHSINKNRIQKYITLVCSCSDKATNYMYNKRIMKNVIEIKNGIETEKFIYSEEKREKIRKELQISDKFVIGHVGRFSYPKNHNFLIEVFKQICEYREDAVLLLVGTGSLQKEIEQKVKEYNLEEKVFFLGSRSNVNELLMAMDIFLFPSFYEGMPVSLIEAQVSGMKCIVSDTITNTVNVTGLICFMSLEDTAEQWAKKIIQESNYERENQYDNIINSGYDIKDTVKKLEEVYKKG